MPGFCVVYNGTQNGVPSFSHTKFSLPKFNDLEEGQVIVELTAATLCNSDIHTITGRNH